MTGLISIKEARNGELIPIINDIHIHSSYNPTLEAQKQVEAIKIQLKEKNNILVLGLGFGYHINEIIKIASSAHPNFDIRVIEPSAELCNSYKNNIGPFKFQVYEGLDPDQLYGDMDLINFLIQKPVIFAHPASFNSRKKYFETFLTFQAPQETREIATLITDPSTKGRLLNCPNYPRFKDYIYQEIMSKEGIDNQTDHFYLAFNHLANAGENA